MLLWEKRKTKTKHKKHRTTTISDKWIFWFIFKFVILLLYYTFSYNFSYFIHSNVSNKLSKQKLITEMSIADVSPLYIDPQPSVNKWKNSRSKWALENNITRCPVVRVSWRQDAEVRTCCRLRALGPLWSPVNQLKPRCERSATMVKEELGSIKQFVLVTTDFSHTTNITFLKIKCQRFI